MKLFIRVELRGTPDGDTYTRLHDWMLANNWYRTIPSTNGTWPLPHATYRGDYNGNISSLANALKDGIEEDIWHSTVVMVVEYNHWAMAGKP